MAFREKNRGAGLGCDLGLLLNRGVEVAELVEHPSRGFLRVLVQVPVILFRDFQRLKIRMATQSIQNHYLSRDLKRLQSLSRNYTESYSLGVHLPNARILVSYVDTLRVGCP